MAFPFVIRFLNGTQKNNLDLVFIVCEAKTNSLRIFEI